MNPQCETCRWWAQVGQTSYGECRAKSPVAKLGSSRVWPTTDRTDYCGEHEPDLQPDPQP